MIPLLVKTYFKGNGGLSFIASFRIRSKKKNRSSIGGYIGFTYLVLLYIFALFIRAMNSLSVSLSAGAFELLITSLLFSILFTLTSVDNVLVKGPDLPILSTLPIKERDLTLSRFVILYSEAFVETLIVVIPYIIASIFLKFTSPIWYLLVLLELIIMPALTVSFMAIFSYLGVKNRLIYRIKSILIWALAILVIFIFLKSFGSFSQGDISFLFKKGGVVTTSSLVIFSLALLGALLLTIIFTLLDIYLAKKVSGFVYTKEKHKRGTIRYRYHSQFSAMLLREWRIVFSHSAISIELILEVIIPAFLLVIYAIMGVASDLVSVFYIDAIQPYLSLLVALTVIFFYIFCLVSSTSVSREGKEFLISKTYPISYKSRVDVKLLFHLITVTPFMTLFLIISFIFFKVSLYESLALIAASILLTANFSLIGLAVDFKNPHTSWSRPQEAVKQNINGFTAAMFNLLLIIIIAAITFFIEFFIKSRALTLVIVNLIPLLLLPILYKKCLKRAKATLS